MTQPLLNALQSYPVPQAAAALRAVKPRVLERWRAEVLQLLPGADELTRRQLENSLLDLLDKIARALDAGRSGPTGELVAASPVHGATRFQQQFNLDELMMEYAILRRAILQEVSSSLGRGLELVEDIEINQAVDIVLREAAIEHAEHQATEMRAEANAMTKYLSFLSHDLRGGLNGVMLMIEVLRREIGNEPRFKSSVEDLETMRRLLLDTVGTMDRFLNAEKLRRGKMPIKIEPVSMREVLEGAARGFAYQSREREIQINVNANSDITVNTDRDLIAMIIQNLTSNAVKYSQRSVVELRAEPVSSDGLACKVSVIDQGPGIAQDKLASLFAPFTRGETYGQKGIGLGLWIARHAADLIGARLWADSRKGQGTTFNLELPQNPPASPAPDLHNTAAKPAC